MTNEQFLNLVSLIDMVDAPGLQEKINEYKELDPSFNINELHYGKHIIEFAIARKSNAIFQILLANDASPNILKGDVAPLHISILYDWELFNLLLNNKHIDVNIKGGFKNTPLHIAAFNNKLEAVNLLIAKIAAINEQNLSGKTPLHYAIDAPDHNDKAEIIIQLLLNGADLEIENKDHITPLAALNILFDLDETLHSRLEKVLNDKWLEAKRTGENLAPKLYFYPNNINNFNSFSLVGLTANVIEQHIGTNPLPLQTFKKYLTNICEKLNFKLEEPSEELIAQQLASNVAVSEPIELDEETTPSLISKPKEEQKTQEKSPTLKLKEEEKSTSKSSWSSCFQS